MIFSTAKSSSVILTDVARFYLMQAIGDAESLLEFAKKHFKEYAESVQVGSKFLAGEIDLDTCENRLDEIKRRLPFETALHGAQLQANLNVDVLSTILYCCLALEAYINSFACFLVMEKNLLGQSFSLEDFYWWPVREKWKKLPKLVSGKTFAHGDLWDSFDELFIFRNNAVHDKPTEWREEGGSGKGKFPDLPFGLFDLSLDNAILAAQTHDEMIKTLHNLTNVPEHEFQRHYNYYIITDDMKERLKVSDELKKITERMRQRE